MKHFILAIFYLVTMHTVLAQHFSGVIRYQIKNEYNGLSNIDSMMVVYGDKQIRVTFYEKDNATKKIISNSFIEDFDQKLHIELSPEGRSYHVSPLELKQSVLYKNTYKYEAVDNQLCLNYQATYSSGSNVSMNKEEALCGINYMFNGVSNYYYWGVQPIVVEDRIVLEYRALQKDGKKLTISVMEAIPLKNTSSYFELWGLKAN